MAKKRRAQGRKPPDPLAGLRPLGPKAIRAQVRADINAQTAPLMADITRRINAQAKAGSENIAGVTSQLAQQLTPLAGQVGGYYDRSIGELQGLNQGLADRLSGLGASMGIAGVGAGAGAASAGAGNASLAALLTNRAAGQSYAGALPGLAGLAGQQQIGALGAEKQRALADQLGEVRTQAGQLTAQLTGDARRRELEKTLTRLGFSQKIAELELEAQQNAESAALKRANLAETRRKNRAAERNRQAQLEQAERELEQEGKLELEKERGRTARELAKIRARASENAKNRQAKASESAKTRRQKARIEGRRQRQRRAENRNKKRSGSGRWNQ